MSRRRLRVVAGVVALPLLLLDAVLLAVLEVFFLPLRFDGLLLPDLGAVQAPIVLLIAAVTTPWLVSQTARWSARMGGPRGLAAAPLVLWLLTVIVVGFMGPGGDRVLVADWRSLALLVCGLVPAAFTLGRALGGAQERKP
ncbi:MAG: hypothetical protein ACRDQ7_00835 [Haloechinothrix sp.]